MPPITPSHHSLVLIWIAIGFCSILVHRYWVMPNTWSLKVFWAENGRKTVQSILMTTIAAALTSEVVSVLPESWGWFTTKVVDASVKAPKLLGFMIGFVCSYIDWKAAINSLWQLIRFGVSKIPVIGPVIIKPKPAVDGKDDQPKQDQ